MDFAAAANYLETLGVSFYTEYEYRGEPGKGREPVSLPFFTKVDPCLRPLDWYHIASREGDSYIGGCCGNYSAIQDIVCGWFRMEARSVPIQELSEVADGMNRHDGQSSYFAQEPWEWDVWGNAGAKVTDWDSLVAFLKEENDEGTNWIALAPWYKLSVIWHLVKDNWVPPQPGAIRRDYGEVDEAIAIVDSIATGISWHRTFSDLSEGSVTPQDQLQRAEALARFIPALRVLTDNIERLDLGDFEGVVLIDLEKGEEAICQNGYGYCVYGQRAEADRIVGIWKKNWEAREDAKKAPIEERFALRTIRVSMKLPRGFEFTGPVERLT
jgi:hypothetical protein